jgi:hypothetical protein
MERYRLFVERRCAILLLALAALVLPSMACAHGGPREGSAAAEAAAEPKPPVAEAAPAEGGAETEPAAPAGEEEALEGEVPEPAEAASGGTADHQPPDGVWLTDEQGRRYFLAQLAKEGLRYKRLEGNRVRTVWGIEIEVEEEDEDFLHYRVYERVPRTGPRPFAGPTEEERAAIRATFQPQAAESRRLVLAEFEEGLPERGQWRNGFDLADLDGDGRLDIVHGPARKILGGPAVFLGDGKGGWRRWSEARFPQLPYDYGDAAVADLNGDGHLDLVLAAHLRGVMALVADGEGGFRSWGEGLDFRLPGGEEGPSELTSRAVAVVDWNGDGRPDIVALGEGPQMGAQARPRPRAEGEKAPEVADGGRGVAVYLNQGDGTWVRRRQEPGPNAVFGDAIAVGDFNGDGRPDFATGSNVLGQRGLLNLGRADGGWDTVELPTLRPKSFVRGLAAGDFDGDGRDDLAVGGLTFEAGEWWTVLEVHLARKQGWERRVLASSEGRDDLTAIGAGDLDGDGHLDLVASTGRGGLWAFLGDGEGSFTREETGIEPDPNGCRGYHVQLADLDGDGRDEIVAGFAGESSALFAPDRCAAQGALRAWDPRPREASGR